MTHFLGLQAKCNTSMYIQYCNYYCILNRFTVFEPGLLRQRDSVIYIRPDLIEDVLSPNAAD